MTTATQAERPTTADDELTRWTLARLATSCDITPPPGHAAIARAAIIAAGLDPLTTFVWIANRGGFERAAYLRSRHNQLLGEPRKAIQPQPYFIIPLDVLDED